MSNYLKEVVGQIIGIAASKVSVTSAFRSLGMDSLMVLELKNRLDAALDRTLSVTSLWNYPTIADLVPYLLSVMSFSNQEQPAPTDHTDRGAASDVALAGEYINEELEVDALLSEIEALSDEEVRRLLAD